MYFLNEEHHKNYLKLLEKYPKAWNESEYQVAIYIIAHPEIYPYTTSKEWQTPFGHLEGSEFISWVENIEFSTGIQYLVDLGRHLYSSWSVQTFPLLDAIRKWDSENYKVFLQALEIRKQVVI